MNTEQMAEQALKEILERTLNGVDAATQFSKEQIPDVVEQLLLWHSVESFMFFIVGFAILITPFAAFRKVKAFSKKYGFFEDGEVGTVFLIGHYVMASLIPLCLGLVITFINLEWLQIIVAPKLYLLEYAAELVK